MSFKLSDKKNDILPYCYDRDDVKEFIMILKTKWCSCNLTKKCAFCRYIDKLAGDELI